MKKLSVIAITMLLCTLTGCATKQPKIATETKYGVLGEWYEESENKLYPVITTEDGNSWEYSWQGTEISNMPAYYDMPVLVTFSDNGTPDNIYDDVILDCAYDRTNAAMDILEKEISTVEGYTIIRKGTS